ncbi:MAG: hypothetical protein CTY31_04235 [Hyphomicrobium sp.]|nr:MAG: hypothetical protein CTY39_03575 [Hyphomicrobium sp.]PPD00364.1 MAG: hypothetical protein CTY31_04235 [Hyphomicrobium sp.]
MMTISTRLAFSLAILSVVTHAPVALAQQGEGALIVVPSQATNQESITTGSLPDPLPAFVSPDALTRPGAANSLREELLQDIDTRALENASASGDNITSPDAITKVAPRPKRKKKILAKKRATQTQSAEYKWNLKIFGSLE